MAEKERPYETAYFGTQSSTDLVDPETAPDPEDGSTLDPSTTSPQQPGKPGKTIKNIALAVALTTALGTCVKETYNSGDIDVTAVKTIEPGKKKYRIKYSFEHFEVLEYESWDGQSIARQAAITALHKDYKDELQYYDPDTLKIISIDHNPITGPEITVEVEMFSQEQLNRQRKIEYGKQDEQAKNTIIKAAEMEKGIYVMNIPPHNSNLFSWNRLIILRNSLAAFQEQHPDTKITVIDSGFGKYKILTLN